MLREAVDDYGKCHSGIEEARFFLELAEEEDDTEALEETETRLREVSDSLADMELRQLLGGHGRPPGRHRHAPSRRRRHRVPGLGRDAAAHVPALGRPARLQDRDHGVPAGRGGGPQAGHLHHRRRVCLRLPEVRGRHPPAGAHLPLRRQLPAPHLLRLGVRLPRDRRRHRRGGQRVRPAHRHLPRQRRRRPARQQDRLRGAHHPPAHQHRGGLPERALTAQEQGHGHAHPAFPPLRAGGGEAAGDDGQLRQGQERHRLGQPDPLLRPPPLPHGQGPPHQRRDRQRRRRPRRRHRPVHPELPDGSGGSKGHKNPKPPSLSLQKSLFWRWKDR